MASSPRWFRPFFFLSSRNTKTRQRTTWWSECFRNCKPLLKAQSHSRWFIHCLEKQLDKNTTSYSRVMKKAKSFTRGKHPVWTGKGSRKALMRSSVALSIPLSLFTDTLRFLLCTHRNGQPTRAVSFFMEKRFFIKQGPNINFASGEKRFIKCNSCRFLRSQLLPISSNKTNLYARKWPFSCCRLLYGHLLNGDFIYSLVKKFFFCLNWHRFRYYTRTIFRRRKFL